MKATEKAKAMKATLSTLGRPPRPDEIVGVLSTASEPPATREEEKSVQLNLRVPARVKQRVRLLAAREGITNSELVMRALAFYEERHGKAGSR